MNDKFFTVKMQKKIVKEIFDEFVSENNITDVKMYPVTVAEYALDSVTSKKYSTDHKNIISAYKYAKENIGFFWPTNNLVVIFTYGKNVVKVEYNNTTSDENHLKDLLDDKTITFINFIDTIYHELSHVLQKKKNNPYLNFIKDIEQSIKYSDIFHYNNNHDSYFSEFDANYRAILYTNKYLKKYPDIYNRSKNYINYLIQERKSAYDSYNFDEFFTKFCRINKEKLFTPKYKSIVSSDWFKTFFTPDGSFYDLDYILSYLKNNRNKIDENISYAILSSTEFLSQIDYSDISYDAAVALKQIIEHKLDEYKIKYKITESRKFLNSVNTILPYLEELDLILNSKTK